MASEVAIVAFKTDVELKRFGIETETIDWSFSIKFKDICTRGGIDSCLVNKAEWSRASQTDLASAKALVYFISRESLYLKARDDIYRYIRDNKNIFICYFGKYGDLTNEILSPNFPKDDPHVQCYDITQYEYEDFTNMLLEKIYSRLTATEGEEAKATVVEEVKQILSESLQRHRPQGDIYSRVWAVDQITSWIVNSSNSPKNLFWVCGEHGTGKSTLAQQIADQRHREDGCIGIYFCQDSNMNTKSCKRIFNIMAYDLCNIVEGYASKIAPVVKGTKFKQLTSEQTFMQLLVDPFATGNDEFNNNSFDFIIDGIDELGGEVNTSNDNDELHDFLSIICDNIELLPKWFRIVITSTKINKIQIKLRHISETLDLSSSLSNVYIKKDASEYLKSELKKYNISYDDRDIDRVLSASNCNFDYLHFYLNDCRDRRRITKEEVLPDGLEAMYLQEMRQKIAKDYYIKNIKPIFELLSAAYEPLEAHDIAQALKLEFNTVLSIILKDINEMLNIVSIDENNRDRIKISIYCPGFKNWLLQQNHEYCIVKENGITKLAEWCIERINNFMENNYLRDYGIEHILERTDKFDKDAFIVKQITSTSPDVFEKIKVELGRLHRKYTELLSIYKKAYAENPKRFRDIMVFTYREIAKRNISPQEQHRLMDEIYTFLRDNNDEIRAELLKGESIEDYDEAKCHFVKTIKSANEKVEKKPNSLWDRRMLGVAHNRLGHLEKANGHIDEAINEYTAGKEQFDSICSWYNENPDQLDEMYLFYRRDEAISNERLGDLKFDRKMYQDAKEHYIKFQKACLNIEERAGKNRSLRNQWDSANSYLRLGDAQVQLKEYSSAQNSYIEALKIRADIADQLVGGSIRQITRIIGYEGSGRVETYYIISNYDNINVEPILHKDVLKETRDMDATRDMAICYMKLGDLAYDLGFYPEAKEYYYKFHMLCRMNDNEYNTAQTDAELLISTVRLNNVLQKS